MCSTARSSGEFLKYGNLIGHSHFSRMKLHNNREILSKLPDPLWSWQKRCGLGTRLVNTVVSTDISLASRPYPSVSGPALARNSTSKIYCSCMHNAPKNIQTAYTCTSKEYESVRVCSICFLCIVFSMRDGV